jgi:hypothetical protein
MPWSRDTCRRCSSKRLTRSRSELRRLQSGLQSDEDTTAEPRLMHRVVSGVFPLGSPSDRAASVAPIAIEVCWRTGVFGSAETVGISTVRARLVP